MTRWLVILIVASGCACRAQGPVFRVLEEAFPADASAFLTLADFDQDGDVDALSFDSNVFLNDGHARFSPHSTPTIVTTASSGFEPAVPIHAVADFTGDGFPDLVSTGLGFSAPWLRLWINQGNGVLQAGTVTLPNPSTLGGRPRAIASGDVDGDGDVDLVVTVVLYGSASWAPYIAHQPELLINTGSGFVNATSQMPAITSSSTQPYLRDVDADGDLDLFLLGENGIASSSYPCSFFGRVLLNSGAGVFSPPANVPGPTSPAHAVLGDVNGDSLPDLLYSSFVSSPYCATTCGVSLNLGGGAFGPFVSAACVSGGLVLAADLNGDGADEVLRLTDSALTVHTASAAGWSPPLQTVAVSASSGRVADLDGDGDRDLVVTLGGRNQILLNDGQGTLVPIAGQLFGIATGEVTAVAGDVDGDGDADYVWCDAGPPGVAGSLGVALNDGDGTLTRASGFCAGGACPQVWTTFAGCAPQPKRLFAVDVNSDGLLDLYVGDATPTWCGAVSRDQIFVNTGGAWALAHTLPVLAHRTSHVKQADLNADGLPDLVLGRDNGGVLVPVSTVVLFNLGAGVFSAPVLLPQHQTLDLALYDAEGDGDLDILQANGPPTQDSCALFLNDGLGAFTATPVFLSNIVASNVATGDLDADGDQDVILDAVVWTQTGPLSYSANSLLPASVYRPMLFDADLDGDLDLVARTFGHALMLNDGTGAFTTMQTFGVNVAYSPYTTAPTLTADFDRDGDVDLALPGPRVFTNVTRQIARPSLLRPGRPASVDVYGPPGASWFLFASTGTATIVVPPIGTVFLDLAGLQLVTSGALPASGIASPSAIIPANPALVGFTTYLQALISGPPRASNLEIVTVLGL